MSEQCNRFIIKGDLVNLKGESLTINLPFDKDARIAFDDWISRKSGAYLIIHLVCLKDVDGSRINMAEASFEDPFDNPWATFSRFANND
jgi:hypothetical protein